MSPVAQIRAARNLLTPAGAWLPGCSFGAVDEAGHSCLVRAPEAVRFGMLAALVRLAGPLDERLQAVRLICSTLGVTWLGAWEYASGRTQAEVLDALDRAVEQAVDGGWR